MHGPFLSLIIPVHNEAATLQTLLEKLFSLAGQFAPGLEIIIIDDASSDSTTSILQGFEGHAGWRVIKHASRKGTGASRKAGHRIAQGQWIAWIDADSTYPPEDVFRLAGEINDSTDQIIGARLHPVWGRNWLRNSFKRMVFAWASWRMHSKIPDLNSGLRLIRRESASCWQEDLPDGFSCSSTATLSALDYGQKIVFCPITYHPRHPLSRSKFHPFSDTLRLLKVVAKFPSPR